MFFVFADPLNFFERASEIEDVQVMQCTEGDYKVEGAVFKGQRNRVANLEGRFYFLFAVVDGILGDVDAGYFYSS